MEHVHVSLTNLHNSSKGSQRAASGALSG